MGSTLTEEKLVEHLKQFESRMNAQMDARLFLTEEKFNKTLDSRLDSRLAGFLTEEKFNDYVKLFDSRMTTLESSVSTFKKEVNTKLDDLKQFQEYEAKAIEYELQKILETHLKHKFPINNIEQFPMKRIFDIHDREITEFDASFLIAPLKPKHNYSRLDRDDMYTMLEKKYIPIPTYKFVFAEAKHHMTTKKIKTKLEQFQNIWYTFNYAHKYLTNPETDSSIYSPQFIKTVQHFNFLGNIETCYLYLGAAFWDPGLLDRFQKMIEEYNTLSSLFSTSKDDRKIGIYRKLCRLESNWYIVSPILSEADILKLSKIDTIYNYVNFILPSGQRFHIDVDTEPVGYLHHVGGGGILPAKHKTRKNHL